MSVKLPYVVVDDSTGQEIVAFLRRGRPYFYLRDRVTKRFIKRLRKIKVNAIITVDYVPEARPYYHSLYIDNKTSGNLTDQEAMQIRKIEDELAYRATMRITQKFGPAILKYLSNIRFTYESKTFNLYDFQYEHFTIWAHRDSEYRLTNLKEDIDYEPKK